MEKQSWNVVARSVSTSTSVVGDVGRRRRRRGAVPRRRGAVHRGVVRRDAVHLADVAPRYLHGGGVTPVGLRRRWKCVTKSVKQEGDGKSEMRRRRHATSIGAGGEEKKGDGK